MATRELTAEEMEFMREHRDRWVAVGCGRTAIDKRQARAGILKLYEAADLARPDVLWCKGPLEALVKAPFLIFVRHFAANSAQEEDGLCLAGIAGQVVREFGMSISVRDVARKIRSRYKKKVCTDLEEVCSDEGYATCIRGCFDALWGGGYVQDWVGWFTGLRELGLLEGEPQEKLALLRDWERVTANSGFWFPFEKLCIMCEPFETVVFDEDNALHCETGPALVTRDGIAMFFWRGIEVPGDWIEKKDEIDVSLVLTHPNLEKRRALGEILGWGKVLAQLEGVRTLDKHPDPQVGTLKEATLPGIGPQKFLEVVCGTGRPFVLMVPDEAQTARQAQHLISGVSEKTLDLIEFRA